MTNFARSILKWANASKSGFRMKPVMACTLSSAGWELKGVRVVKPVQQIQRFIRKGRTTMASADFCTPIQRWADAQISQDKTCNFHLVRTGFTARAPDEVWGVSAQCRHSRPVGLLSSSCPFRPRFVLRLPFAFGSWLFFKQPFSASNPSDPASRQRRCSQLSGSASSRLVGNFHPSYMPCLTHTKKPPRNESGFRLRYGLD